MGVPPEEVALVKRADRIGLLVLLLTAMTLTALTPAALSAGLWPVSRAGVACVTTSPAVAARAASDGSNRGLEATGRSVLGKRGEIVGRSLSARAANGAQLAVELPVESFVGDAVDDLVVYTTYVPSTGSQVRGLDLVTGCDSLLASPSEIVRSAALSDDGASVYVHSVTKSGRADAGVTRFDLASGSAAQVVPPLRPNDRLGPIFGTELHFRPDGRALAVQSCGMSACLTRVVDLVSGSVATYDNSGQGEFVSIDEQRLVTYTACGGMPCDLISIDLATGKSEVQR
jgi:hypothetical protein